MNSEKRIAWDGVSFPIPANWELALYRRIKRKIWHLEIEDEYALRLEVEWIQQETPLDVETILKRYQKATEKLAPQAFTREEVANLPTEWTATYYTFAESETKKGGGLGTVKHGLATAFYIPADERFFCFILLHVYPEDMEGRPQDVLRTVAEGFKRHQQNAIPWQMFDIAFRMPRDFLLESTSFGVGSKLTVFRWRMRLFYLWHLSCADKFLTDGVRPEAWIAAFLNDFKPIRAVVFEPGPNGTVRWRRRKRNFLGHRDELARGCLQYEIRYLHDRKANRLILWVFNYRKATDLDRLPKPFMFGR